MEIQKVKLSDLPSESLKAAGDAPELLYALGDLAISGLKCIAIVGTRRPSQAGIAAAYRFAAQLALKGFCIVSGLARGIDAAAHRGALSVGGLTIGVLGHGLDRIYPAANRGLAREILQKRGLLLSEYESGTPPFPHHFPARNRIVSGLSVGVVVVEAIQRSGSLITARLAADQGREVYVVPGRFDDPLYEGSHFLIQQGARLITGPEAITEDLAPMLGISANPLPAWNNEDLDWGAFFTERDFSVTLEELIEKFGPSFSKVHQKIGELQSRALLIESQPQRYVWVGPGMGEEHDSTRDHSETEFDAIAG